MERDAETPYLTLNGTKLRELVDHMRWGSLGDEVEARYGFVLDAAFPNMQRFWQLFVAPLTERIEFVWGVLTLSKSGHVAFRPGIDERLEDMSSLHYSAFCHLVHAHEHLRRLDAGEALPSWLEDVYVHLVSVSDLAKEFVGLIHLLLLQAGGAPSHVLSELTLADVLERAKTWYKKEYPRLYSLFARKGNFPPVRLIDTGDLMREFLSRAKQEELWQRFNELDTGLRQLRNQIVHNIIIGKLKVGGRDYIPRPDRITQYRHSRQLRPAYSDAALRARDFVPSADQARQDLESLERTLNEVWDVVIAQLEPMLYTGDNEFLRDLYRLRFQKLDAKGVNEVENLKAYIAHHGVSTSDAYTGDYRPARGAGSADWFIDRPGKGSAPGASPLGGPRHPDMNADGDL